MCTCNLLAGWNVRRTGSKRRAESSSSSKSERKMSSTPEPGSPSAIIQKLLEPRTTTTEFTELLRSVLYGGEYAGFRASLREDEVQSFIEILDKASKIISPNDKLYHKALRSLRKICGETGLLPSAITIKEGLEKSGDIPTAAGSFAEVWKGTYQGREVAIKACKIYGAESFQKVKKLYCKEVVVWRRLSHINVLPFLGVSTTVFKLAMVSEWMSNGTITDYVEKHPEANRLRLLLDVVNGLQFLHKARVIHGDLKGPNILINDAGRACLADFGLSSITLDAQSLNASTARYRGSARWMAPELLNPDDPTNETAELTGNGDALEAPVTMKDSRPTEESDVYALAMVVIEVMSGRVPFFGVKNEAVMFRVVIDVRPGRPAHPDMKDEIWEMVQSCWCKPPHNRSKLVDVIKCLERALNAVRRRKEREIKPALQPQFL